MELKDSCRLCLGKDGEFYKLFDATHGGCTLADELNTLLNFKIENKEHLPELICANCYKINSFFKEFRNSCARVNDKFNRILESKNHSFTDVTIKTEKAADLENDGDLRKESASKELQKSDTENVPCPISMVSADYGENLEQLRSNFRGVSGLGVGGATSTTETEPQSTETSSTRGKKRKNENSKDECAIQDPLLTVVKREYISDEDADVQEEDFARLSDLENDTSEFSAVNGETSLGVNSSRNLESQVNSGSNQSNDSVANTSNLPVRTSSGNVNEGSVLPSRKRRKTMLEEENESTSNGREGSPFMYEEIPHEVKQEEIEIFDPPFEDENEFVSSEGQESPERRLYSSDGAESDPNSSEVEDGEFSSSGSSESSDESDEDTEMLLCLALLL